MADEQELPDEGREGTPPPPPVDKAPPAEETAAKTPPAKKTPAKKASVRKSTPRKAAAKKAPAKKAPAKKTPAKKAPAKKAPPPVAPPVAEVNRSDVLPDGPKQAAAQAKDTVDRASDLLSQPALAPAEVGRSPIPVVVALVISIIAVLLVRQLRRSGGSPE